LTKNISKRQLRLRVFAGPNGSGKSTLIGQVRKYQSRGALIEFGHYINADDIASALSKKWFSFAPFHLHVHPSDFKKIAVQSGLVNNDFNEAEFAKSYSLQKNIIRLKISSSAERLAQIIADFLRKTLLEKKERFSFETVFSHHSKLDIMRQASAAGYKVYLYFVCTVSPEINKERVLLRKKEGGHEVHPDKIERRYYRSLNLMYDAAQIAYQAFFFDNSFKGQELKMFAHFKKQGEHKMWDKLSNKEIPNWFIRFYSKKIPKKRLT
jgi:predicted ABC-type ATPase